MIENVQTALLVTVAAVTITACSDQPAVTSKASAAPPRTVATVDTPSAPVVRPLPVTKKSVAPDTQARAATRRPPKMDPLTPPFERSTLSGVYTAADARDGRDLYLGFCASCHAAVSHTGPAFRLKWAGRPLSDLFMFMRTNMPKNDPASLDDQQYGVLLAYMLQMNKMPSGRTPLSPDPADLAKIRIDTVRKN